MAATFDPTSLPPRWRERDGRFVLDAWQCSGLSVRAFARRHRLRERRLYRWCKRLGVELRRPAPPPSLPGFVEVVHASRPVREQREPFVVRLADASVRVPTDFDPERLADLVAVLRC